VTALPKTILVPIDFSAGSEAALDYAAALATKLGARLVLLNAIGIPALAVPELGLAVTNTMIESLVHDNRRSLDLLIEQRCAGISCEPLLRTGDPRDVILHTAEEAQADLIVMGTHGRRGVRRVLLGSVAETTVRMSKCPVLTIRTA
jgi:nucleotide-binding universal stress UspA family protein